MDLLLDTMNNGNKENVSNSFALHKKCIKFRVAHALMDWIRLPHHDWHFHQLCNFLAVRSRRPMVEEKHVLDFLQEFKMGPALENYATEYAVSLQDWVYDNLEEMWLVV
jgi:hypothetical protein